MISFNVHKAKVSAHGYSRTYWLKVSVDELVEAAVYLEPSQVLSLRDELIAITAPQDPFARLREREEAATPATTS